jgi:hypothetical protein
LAQHDCCSSHCFLFMYHCRNLLVHNTFGNHSSPSYQCPQEGCNRTFISNGALTQHIRKKHIIVRPEAYEPVTPGPSANRIIPPLDTPLPGFITPVPNARFTMPARCVTRANMTPLDYLPPSSAAHQFHHTSSPRIHDSQQHMSSSTIGSPSSSMNIDFNFDDNQLDLYQTPVQSGSDFDGNCCQMPVFDNFVDCRMQDSPQVSHEGQESLASNPMNIDFNSDDNGRDRYHVPVQSDFLMNPHIQDNSSPISNPVQSPAADAGHQSAYQLQRQYHPVLNGIYYVHILLE